MSRALPVTAGLSFLVATPDLGLDAFLISLALLGVELTLVRVAAAVAVAFAVALVVGRSGRRRSPSTAAATATAPAVIEAATAAPRGPLDRIVDGLRGGLGELVDHVGPWILAGLALGALAEPVFAAGSLRGLAPGLQVALFGLLGVPIYLGAAGATPLVAVLLHKGLSPGAAVAFLLTGPAVNVVTHQVLSRLHGRRLAYAYATLTVTASVAVGLVVDLAIAPAPSALYAAAAAPLGVWRGVSLVVLTGLLLASLFRQGPRGFFGQVTSQLGAGRHRHHHHEPHDHRIRGHEPHGHDS